MTTQKRNKTTAREILLFFAILVLTGLVWIFMLLKNYVYENKLNSFQQKQNSITTQIENLPSDKIKALYDGVKEDFVVNYIVNDDKYTIPKKKENEFLKDYPTAILDTAIQNEYSILDLKDKKTKDGLPIFKHLVFDFVDLEKFRQYLKDTFYRNNFYKTFSVNYDLGTFNSFLSKVDTGLKFTNTTALQYQKFLKEQQELQKSIDEVRNHLNSKKEIWQIVVWTFLISAIMLYPLRLCYYLIKWSIVTLQKNGT